MVSRERQLDSAESAPPAGKSDGGAGNGDGAPSAAAITLALILLTAATSVAWGFFTWTALILIIAANAICILAHCGVNFRGPPAEKLLTGVVIAFAAATCYLQRGQCQSALWATQTISLLAAAGVLLACGYILDIRPAARRAAFWLLAIIAVAARTLMPVSAPEPTIDVFWLQQIGAEEFHQGHNIYEMSVPLPSAPNSPNNIDQLGGYPPATLLGDAASWRIAGDVRAGWVICDLLGALFIYLVARRMNPERDKTRLRELATLAFLFFPRSLFVIEQAWTEPLCVAALGGFAFAIAAGRGGIAQGAALGLLLGGKQYMITAIPLLLRARLRPRVWIFGAALAAALAIPFLLWNFDAVINDVFLFFVNSATRADALSINGALMQRGHELSFWIVAPLWLAGIIFYALRARRDLSGILFAMAGTWLFFFLFGKQAFMNYFYLIAYALILSLAARPVEKNSA